ncbi:penicillin acylase family protein [Oscillochloris sp. ZM17-4]|uniref:penicillin acylase family protein n=1 Tax=Oscillochloris sp. ZM17-4 TaxID=2866714 RepID=UPI001C73D32A|nr:penicillin acylase family protein [Oscillochloris sp. ZM17-4]MBX0329303.1 penicillin acylase family protein [Oscillochloris sp. ZM17-4]
MKLFSIAGKTLAVVAILALALAGGGYLWLRRSLPVTSGTVQVAGISAPVTIARDSDGVPHIRGQSEADALFGLGYAHAQDRLWQMEFQRRIGGGRLSEVFGESTLDTDRFLRTLGVRRAAASAAAALSPATRALLDAYVAGVNAYVDGHRDALPVEFAILGVSPEPWSATDVIAWQKMMAWDLGGNWTDELLRAHLEAQLGPEAAAQLMPGSGPSDPIILPDGGDARRDAPVGRPDAPPGRLYAGTSGLLAIDRQIQESLGLGGELIGSNNWVIAGSRTTTGMPLLANDPHLGAQIPSIWYLAQITGGAIDAIGATLPGLPGIVIGHNARIAWGVTNTGPDVQDLYAEHVNARNEVEYQGQWEPLTIIPETIKVKGQDDLTLYVRVSRHGPLISDVTAGTGDPLAFRWTALDPEDNTMEAFLGIDRAGSWDEFTAALTHYHAPMQNFVFADVDGNIGYYAPGALPVRAQGDGSRIAPGWDGSHDWTGYAPFAGLPHSYNPPAGFIATANNKVVPEGYPYLIGTAFAAPYRAARIVELIQSKPKLSPDDIAAMQADVVSLQAREILPYLLEAVPAGARERQALDMLRGWDGSMAGDSAAAAVYNAYYQAIPQQLFGDELRDLFESDYTGETGYHAMVIAQTLADQGAPWCDDVNTPAAESCADTLGLALTAGLEDMATAQGSENIATWRWDKVHLTMFPHNPFDKVGALKPIFSRSVPNGGDGFTVDVAPVRRSELYKQYHVPSYREIINLGDLDASRFMHTTGQSGQALSNNYSNFITRWQKVEYLPMRFSPAAVEAAGAGILTLAP